MAIRQELGQCFSAFGDLQKSFDPDLLDVLDEKGCSDNQERKEILEKFITEFGLESIRFVTADREFCSKEWLAYLIENRISYRLRVKANYQITNAKGELIRASKLCRTLKTGVNTRNKLIQ